MSVTMYIKDTYEVTLDEVMSMLPKTGKANKTLDHLTATIAQQQADMRVMAAAVIKAHESNRPTECLHLGPCCCYNSCGCDICTLARKVMEVAP